MIKTLRISFSLRFTATVNQVLYLLRHIPLLGRCFPGEDYRNRRLKAFAAFLAFFVEIFRAFLGKIVYFGGMIGLASLPYPMADKGALFGHFLVFLTLTGGWVNGYLFDVDPLADQAVLLLGMDARRYTLGNFAFQCGKVLVAYSLCSVICGGLMGAPLWLCLLAPLYTLGVKLAMDALRLKRLEKAGQWEENAQWAVVMLLLGGPALAYGLPALGIWLPLWLSGAVMVLGIVAGVLSAGVVLTFGDYRYLRQQLRAQAAENARELDNAQEKAGRGQITDRMDVHSSRKGFAYLNDLFIQRHRKLFWQPSLIFAAVAACVVAAVVVALRLVPELREPINSVVLELLPASAFLMYLINRGAGFTQALFVNCDRSLLTYSFYKRPGYILRLFALRLRGIIAVNLVPALVIAVGLPLVLYASGGTAVENYFIVFATILALSVFFSVHCLTLYYLLQPYTAGSEMKSGLYTVISGGTYLVCYLLLDNHEKLPPILFCVGAIVFSVVYCVVACLLVYFLAPKTFRIRN